MIEEKTPKAMEALEIDEGNQGRDEPHSLNKGKDYWFPKGEPGRFPVEL